MIKHFQTDISRDRGNCQQYALASLLDLQPGQVPNLHLCEDWRAGYVEWLEKNDYEVVFIPFDTPTQLSKFLQFNSYVRLHSPYCLYVLACVKSFVHKDKNHAVVARIDGDAISIAHDPNPANANRKQSEYEIIEIDIIRRRF